MSGELVELGRRLKRSLDGYLSYRRAAAIAVITLVFFLYLGPSAVRWLTGRGRGQRLHPLAACLQERVLRYEGMLARFNGHKTGGEFVSYTGNGHFGLSVNPDSEIYIKSKRTLSLPVNFKPLVSLYLEGGEAEESIQVTDYLSGLVSRVQCLGGGEWEQEEPLTLTSTVYAHRTLPGVLVQDIKVHNPGQKPAQLAVEKIGIANWEGAISQPQVIEHGEGGQQYSLVSGRVRNGSREVLVSLVTRRLDQTLTVAARMTTSLHILTGVAYADLRAGKPADQLQSELEKKAVSAVASAAALPWQTLQDSHTEAWRSLWTTGFGISWSYAEGAVNGNRVNATIYYVLTQAASHLLSTASDTKRAELNGYLSYAEGCYSGIRTLEAPNLWTPLTTVSQVMTVCSYWLLTLEKNGCHYLLKAGADGVVQAMVLSLPGLKFSNQHLELDVHPKELHRDLSLRRVNYGNETHVNISIHVMEDNRAAMFVSLDKKNRDYYACDAGCLDPPVKLGPAPVQFPVKLTEPLTAILYITADHEHMEDLKHTIHVKEVVEAPAHEPHVLELHRTGGRLGGLPVIFWLSIASIIIVFHLFLVKLIYNEYCAGSDNNKYRSRKYSDRKEFDWGLENT